VANTWNMPEPGPPSRIQAGSRQFDASLVRSPANDLRLSGRRPLLLGRDELVARRSAPIVG